MDESPHRPSLPLSVIGRLRVALADRLIRQGFEVVEEHPDHVVAMMDGQRHTIYLNNLARAVELSMKTGIPDRDALRFGAPAGPAVGSTGPADTPDDATGRGGEPAGSAEDGAPASGPPGSQEQLLMAVDAWLAAHLRQLQSRQRFEETYRTLEAARPVLLPRVVAPAGATDPGRRWSRPLCEGLLELAIVIDQPDAVAFATPQMVAGWGAEPAEAAAMDNLRARVSPDDFRPLPEAGELRMCSANDSYAASRVLLAEELLADPGSGEARTGANSPPFRQDAEAGGPRSPFGLLAALPSRDLLFCEPIGPRTVQDIVYLALLASKSADQLPYPLSGEVFWLRGGRWTHIPIRIAEGRMDVDSPPELAAILQELMGGDLPSLPPES